MAIMPACTDLQPDVYSSLPADKFGQSQRELVQEAGRAFSHLQNGTSDLYGFWGMKVVPTDETVIPYRVQNLWYDGGEWIALYTHNFSPDLFTDPAAWDFIFGGVSICNQIIYQIGQSSVQFKAKDKIVAQLKMLRAWYYLQAMDLWGNVPISTDFSDPTPPKQSSRKEVFNFVEKQIKDNISDLDPYPTGENYGRPTQAMANMMLAKLYLNADVWVGTPMWDKAIDATNKIINSGSPLQLESNYFANFAVHNENSKENIFVVPEDRVNTAGWTHELNLEQYTLHTLSQQTFGILAFCWDGMAATEDFYKSYDKDDSRIDSWLEGPQYDANGNPLMLTADHQLNYRPHVKSLNTDGNRALLDDGVRFQKYRYESGIQEGQSMSNDWVIYRYADALMIKAEALMRKNGGTATPEAVNLVNKIRERAFGDASHDYTTSTLTMDTLLAELGREFAWEGHRRDDLIRFGKWTDSWWEKPATADYKKLFPIPTGALSDNTNLKQNPGY